MTYDVIVVGTRVAGSSTAMLLARSGLRVLAVDRATFPSDTISTHQVQITGGAVLKRWGMLGALEDAGTPATRAVWMDTGDVTLQGHFPTFDGCDALFSPRRTLLDTALVKAAREAGAEVRENFTVDEVVIDEGVATGIRGREVSAPITERARLVIGADGKHSKVAESVGPRCFAPRPRTVAVYTYWSGLPVAGGEVYSRPHRGFAAWPTNDGLTLSYMAWPIAEFDVLRGDIEGGMIRTMDGAGLGERVHGAERAERIRTTPDTPNMIRQAFGPGWALAGDAGLVMDPITGQGIGHAFRDAELLTEAVRSGFAGERSMDEALAEYAAERDRDRIPMWEFTIELAAFGPPRPETQVLFEKVAASKAETDRFFGVLGGAVPLPEYLAPSNLRKIVGVRGFAKIALAKARARRAA